MQAQELNSQRKSQIVVFVVVRQLSLNKTIAAWCLNNSSDRKPIGDLNECELSLVVLIMIIIMTMIAHLEDNPLELIRVVGLLFFLSR